MRESQGRLRFFVSLLYHQGDCARSAQQHNVRLRPSVHSASRTDILCVRVLAFFCACSWRLRRRSPAMRSSIPERVGRGRLGRTIPVADIMAHMLACTFAPRHAGIGRLQANGPHLGAPFLYGSRCGWASRSDAATRCTISCARANSTSSTRRLAKCDGFMAISPVRAAPIQTVHWSPEKAGSCVVGLSGTA